MLPLVAYIMADGLSVIADVKCSIASSSLPNIPKEHTYKIRDGWECTNYTTAKVARLPSAFASIACIFASWAASRFSSVTSTEESPILKNPTPIYQPIHKSTILIYTLETPSNFNELERVYSPQVYQCSILLNINKCIINHLFATLRIGL